MLVERFEPPTGAMHVVFCFYSAVDPSQNTSPSVFPRASAFSSATLTTQGTAVNDEVMTSLIEADVVESS